MAQLAKTVAVLFVACLVQGLSSDSSAVASATAAATAKEEQAIRAVPRITIDELKVLMAQKAVVVLDVREPGSFQKGRIPGAINIDYTQVLAKAAQFAGEKRTIVAYCACANEMTAARAAVDLAASGIPGAKALKGGWDEWVARAETIER
jgi:rhodanese-related sulfurtransferase